MNTKIEISGIKVNYLDVTTSMSPYTELLKESVTVTFYINSIISASCTLKGPEEKLTSEDWLIENIKEILKQ